MLDRFVLHNARCSGQEIAFGGINRHCCFSELEASVSRVARALKSLCELDLKVVGVQCADSWHHWMLTLALGRLGIASASLPSSSVSAEMLNVLSADLIIVSGGDLEEEEQRLFLKRDWFENVLEGVKEDKSENYLEPLPVDPNAVCRIALTMGTERSVHAVELSFSEVEASLLRLVYQNTEEALGILQSVGQKPHLLCTIEPVSVSGFMMLGAALVSMTTIREVDPQNIGAEIIQAPSLFVVMTPVHLEHLLVALPPGQKPLKYIHLTVIGAVLSDGLLQRARRYFTPHISVAYGVDECGLISRIPAFEREEAHSVGRVLPWMTIEIVDENEKSLPKGEEGRIRLKGNGVVRAYIDDNELTAQRFRDGWFYPGDRGFVSERGELHLLGRVDEIVAIGGAKFDLSIIDDTLRADDVVQDAGSFVAWDEEGRQVLYAAVVTEDGDVDGCTVSRKLRERYPSLPPLTLIWVRQIPYFENGYVNRSVLEHSLKNHLKTSVE